MVEIAGNGLKRRRIASGTKGDECSYIETLQEIAESGISPAEKLLERFENDWGGDISRVYEETTY
jgi:glutamate--cysteine ligase